jgi:DNA-directed RNA polymerase subunit beta
VLRREDLVAIVAEIINLQNGKGIADDIDNLANRRLKMVGELMQSKFRIGLARMERIVKDRMSVYDTTTVTPGQLVNVRPIVASVREFFASSQLSQFMSQINPLDEVVHKRRLNAMGPGGLSRERAGFEVRDVHKTHYGRLCPIETPEGPNIGLVSNLSTYARSTSTASSRPRTASSSTKSPATPPVKLPAARSRTATPSSSRPATKSPKPTSRR